MKKVIALLLALLMVFGLAACGTPSNNSGNGNTQPETPKWPADAVTLYFPYNESSATAQNANVLADWIREQTGAKVEVEFNATGNGEALAQKLLKEDADGLQIMAIGLDALTAFHEGVWSNDPTDTSKFTIVTGMIQPYPYSGCMLITQKDSPFDDWESLVKQIEAYPYPTYSAAKDGHVTVANRTGSIMTTKIKALFIQAGLYDKVEWVTCNRDELSVGIENGAIQVSIHDETNAAKSYLSQPDKYKGIINCRADNEFGYYPADTANLDLIKAVPTLLDVFGKDKAESYNVPNTTALIVKAGTDPAIVAQIKECIDGLENVPQSTDEKSFYVRQRNQGGTSKYYTWPAADILTEWQRLSAIIKDIVKGK